MMTFEEVKEIALNTIQQFTKEGISDPDLLNWLERLNIEDEIEMKKEIDYYDDPNYNLYRDHQKVRELKREKGGWFSSKYLDKVKSLLATYPDNHQTIIKNLNLSKASYYRLLHKQNCQRTHFADQRRSQRKSKNFTRDGVVFVNNLVSPPTFPITLKEI